MPKYYAWEGVKPGSKVVHAVGVLFDAELRPQTPRDSRNGDRNTETFCGRKVGQGISVGTYSPRRYTGTNPLFYDHVRLRLASEVKHLEKCKNCLKGLDARRRGRSTTCWRWPGAKLVKWEEWKEDMPLYLETPVIVNPPAPAPYPTYYRYAFAQGGAAATTLNCWLPQGTVMTGMWSATTNTQLTWDFTQYGQDWHHDYYRAAVAPTPAPVSDAPSYAEQERIQRVRTRQQMDWMRVARNIDARNDVHVAFVGRDMRAIELAKDIMGIDAIRQLAESGYVDVPSHTDGIGYRLRPWRRIGCLTRSRDGAWAEIAMSLCIHPDDTYPPGDELAALWLELRFNEESLLRRANRHYTLADPGGEYRLETDRTPYPVLLARTLLAREEAA